MAEFETLLQSKQEPKEKEDILPFFRSHRQLASFVGTYIPDIARPDQLALEYDLFGDFTCDLAIGDSTSKTFLLVEFEDALPSSLFKAVSNKATPEWSPRLEHGFSQVIDWFWKLSDVETSDAYEHQFGTRHASIHGMVVIGREQPLSPRERTRLRWRQDHTVVHSKKLSVVTFDQLASDLRCRLSRYPEAARVDLP